MGTDIKKKQNKIWYISYAVIGIFILAAHAFMVTGMQDDAWFADMLDMNTLSGYLIWRYREWSSRIPIETAFVLFTHWNPWIWRVCNTLMILLLIHSVSELFVWKDKVKWVAPITVLLALIPMGMLHSAGWMTTTISYIWPAALGLYAMIPLRKWQDGTKPAKHQYITVVLALLYATAQEQVAAILICSYLFIGLYLYKNKKLHPYWWVVMAVCVLAVINIMICPGNAIRNEVTIAGSFPEFAYLNFFEKAFMGYVSTFCFFISCEGYNMIFVALTGTLAFAVFYKNQDLLKGNVALVPFLCTLLLGLFGRIGLENGWIVNSFWLELLQNDQLQQFTAYETYHLVIECVVFALVWMCVLLEVYWVFEKTWRCLLVYMILFAGIASRMILGFTPSIYVSESRTAFFCCIAFLVAALLVVQECCKWKSSKWYVGLMSGFYLLLLAGTIYFEDFTHVF